MNKKINVILLNLLFSIFTVYSANILAKAEKIVIESGNSPASNETAREHKEQWDNTRSLRNKINRRSEKEYDKIDHAYDAQDSCKKSLNINAYWEPDTLRCLDRRTGREITSP